MQIEWPDNRELRILTWANENGDVDLMALLKKYADTSPDCQLAKDKLDWLRATCPNEYQLYRYVIDRNETWDLAKGIEAKLVGMNPCYLYALNVVIESAACRMAFRELFD